jgi:hypothetical protein
VIGCLCRPLSGLQNSLTAERSNVEYRSQNSDRWDGGSRSRGIALRLTGETDGTDGTVQWRVMKYQSAINWLRWKLSIPIILIVGKAKRHGWADILLFYGVMALLSAIVLMM